MERLLAYPFVEQRSPEWFRLRHGMITASSCADVLGKNPYSSYRKFLASKVFPETPFEPGVAMHHGVKYEPVATMLYQKLGHAAGGTVGEFGLVQHPTIQFLGASPDGIIVDGRRRGTMLEIKCPFRRRIRPGNTLKAMGVEYYWIQIQVQLECCDLETCDFWQCDIQESKTKEEWEACDTPNKGCIIEWFTDELEEKRKQGLVVDFDAKYIYPPMDVLADDDNNKTWDDWVETASATVPSSTHRVIWWYLKTSLCTPVQRDRGWFQESLPKLQHFWDEVEYYRQNPAQFVQVQREEMKAYFKKADF